MSGQAESRDPGKRASGAPSARYSTALRYGSAAVAIGLALLARLAVDPYLRNDLPYATFLVAIMAVAWFAGLGPALLCTPLGFLTANWFFVPPRGAIASGTVGNAMEAGAYFVFSLAIALFSRAMHRARQQALSRQRDLEAEIVERQQADERMRLTLNRFELLSRTASDLLATDRPQALVERLCHRVMEHLDCQYFFNFLMDKEAGKLHLNACAGIPPEEAARIEWLELGVAVCGCAAQSGKRIVAEHISTTPDKRTDLVRSYGIQAYACHPLLAGGKVIGTLSFGTRTRPTFTEDELSLLKAVTDQVAMAMERIRLFDQARPQAAELAAANKTKDEFIAALSHELRTPLTPVLIISQLLQEDASLPERVRGDMKTIRQNVLLEARLIDDLLDLTRVTRGKVQLQRETVDVHDLLRDAAQTCCDEQFSQKRLKLRWELSARPSSVWADPARLEQVFWNLIRNAIKYTPADGSITIRTDVAGRERLRVEIVDTGEGIEPGRLSSIFNPFEQGGWDKTRRFGGLGLGLAIVKAIMDLHGGRIEAASEGRGRGATFSVELKLSAPTQDLIGPASGSTGHEGSAGNGTPRILLVEDHPPTAIVLQRLMALWGWDVKWAGSARAALQTAGQHRFDLVISDLGLPDGSGHEVMRQLRDSQGLRGIAVSGYGTDEDIRTSLDSGFIQHLTKPLDFDELKKAALGALGGESAGGRAADAAS